MVEQCYCGTKADFNVLIGSDACVTSEEAYCSGDNYEICGGESAIRVYSRSIVTLAVAEDYEELGCYIDGRSKRIMSLAVEDSNMSTEVSNGAFL